jgi:hypothetical protein
MPLLYVDLIEGRTPAEIQALLDAVVETFGVPPRDRYQVVSTHPAHEIVAWDRGLGIERSSRLVVLHVSRRRSREMKQRFYRWWHPTSPNDVGSTRPTWSSPSPTTATQTGLSATVGHSS